MQNSETSSSVPVVCVAFLNDKKVLAFRRAPGKASAGKWEFPGGKVEQGESLEAALIREIREELSFELGEISFLNQATTVVGEISIDLTCYLSVQAQAVLPASTDHDEVLWVNSSEAVTLDWAAPDLPALQALLEKDLI